jgi:hypothetical protein
MARVAFWLAAFLATASATAVIAAPSAAFAQGKPKAKAAVKAKPKKGPAPAAKPAADPAAADKTKEPDAEPKELPKSDGSEATVKSADAPETKNKKGEGDVVKVEESAKEKGVKTYQFSAIEVEGRLKSPQIIYFLRRVRAEFDAGALGHRSFMPELSDSRRSPSLR